MPAILDVIFVFGDIQDEICDDLLNDKLNVESKTNDRIFGPKINEVETRVGDYFIINVKLALVNDNVAGLKNIFVSKFY